jgi:hypothetical protein
MRLDAWGFEILSKARLFYAPETWAPPAISNGRLFINQNEMGSRLICYDISGEEPSESAEPLENQPLVELR